MRSASEKAKTIPPLTRSRHIKIIQRALVFVAGAPVQVAGLAVCVIALVIFSEPLTMIETADVMLAPRSRLF
jgi:hypothetical protein